MGRRCGGRGGGGVVVVVAAWWCWGAGSGRIAGARRPASGPLAAATRRHHLRENPRRPGLHPLTTTGAPSGGEGGATPIHHQNL